MAEAKSLEEILKRINKKQENTVVSVGVEDLTTYGTLSLGSPGLDFCLYNSFPERKIIELCGADGSGKTSLAYLICSSFQKKELKVNKESPRKILYVDLECSVDTSWASKCGYDMNTNPVQTICYRPEDQSDETIFDDILDMIKTGEIGLTVIDSLSMLVSQQVHDESMEKKEMGGIAKVLGDFVKRVTSLLVKYNCTLIGINQLRENIGGYGNPLVTSGGRG
jgi:recombination protein RecA